MSEMLSIVMIIELQRCKFNGGVVYLFMQTGLRKLRQVADSATLAGALAPEPPGTFDEREEARHPNQEVSPAVQAQLLREWASGANLEEAEARYGVSRGYIRQAMLRKFGGREGLLEALRALVLENAVGAQMIAQEKLPELTGPQAVFAGKLLVETMANLENQIQATPKTIEFGAFARLGETLKNIREIVSAKKACPPGQGQQATTQGQ